VSAMAPEVVEVWRADDKAAEEHVHATLALRSGAEDRGQTEGAQSHTHTHEGSRQHMTTAGRRGEPRGHVRLCPCYLFSVSVAVTVGLVWAGVIGLVTSWVPACGAPVSSRFAAGRKDAATCPHAAAPHQTQARTR
jgi:hypothetical protein